MFIDSLSVQINFILSTCDHHVFLRISKTSKTIVHPLFYSFLLIWKNMYELAIQFDATQKDR